MTIGIKNPTWYPFHISSFSARCGNARGVTGHHRRHSLTVAKRYGRWLKSSHDGGRPQSTRLNSSCDFATTVGLLTHPNMKQCSRHEVVFVLRIDNQSQCFTII